MDIGIEMILRQQHGDIVVLAHKIEELGMRPLMDRVLSRRDVLKA